MILGLGQSLKCIGQENKLVVGIMMIAIITRIRRKNKPKIREDSLMLGLELALISAKKIILSMPIITMPRSK